LASTAAEVDLAARQHVEILEGNRGRMQPMQVAQRGERRLDGAAMADTGKIGVKVDLHLPAHLRNRFGCSFAGLFLARPCRLLDGRKDERSWSRGMYSFSYDEKQVLLTVVQAGYWSMDEFRTFEREFLAAFAFSPSAASIRSNRPRSAKPSVSCSKS
jgi:hypothetical protein